MITHIALTLVLSILAQFGVKPDYMSSYTGQNEGFCVSLNEAHNELCVETKGNVGVFLYNSDSDDNTLDLSPLQKPDSTLSKVLRFFDCSVDFQTRESQCYKAGDVEQFEDVEGDEYYTHKPSRFMQAYNLRVFGLPVVKN